MAAVAENLVAQLQGGLALDTQDTNMAWSIDSLFIYAADSRLTIEARSGAATVTNICPTDAFATVSYSDLTIPPAQAWDGTRWDTVDEKSKLHVFLVRLYVLQLMLEQTVVAVVGNGSAMTLSSAGAVFCFDCPKERLAAREAMCEIDATVGALSGSVLFSPARRWALRSCVREAGGENRPIDPVIVCNHTEQLSLLHPIEAGDVGQG
jgi:hypothetical protein